MAAGYFLLVMRPALTPLVYKYESHERRRVAAIEIKAEGSELYELDANYTPSLGIDLYAGNPGYIMEEGADG